MIVRDGRRLCAGSQAYLQRHPRAMTSAGIVLRVHLHGAQREEEDLAIFDTGATWSVLNSRIADALHLIGEPGEETIAISTRLGTFMGELIRLGLTLPTDDGEVVSLEVPFLVCEDWYAPTFLGYQGLMDRLAFAVDPSDDTFHFGIAGEAP